MNTDIIKEQALRLEQVDSLIHVIGIAAMDEDSVSGEYIADSLRILRGQVQSIIDALTASVKEAE